MALTRKFFTRLAADYKALRPEPGTEEREMWSRMIVLTASALAEQNAMFNYGKFYAACGMESS